MIYTTLNSFCYNLLIITYVWHGMAFHVLKCRYEIAPSLT